MVELEIQILVEALRIVCGSVLAAVLYGVAHDQVTARVCVEYFTIGHDDYFGTTSPTLLALGWGVLATWWVGLMLGIPLAMAARLGPNPKLTCRELRRPIGILLLCMGTVSLVAGLAGYFQARSGAFWPDLVYASMMEPDRYVLFLADACAHNAAYSCGYLGGLVLCISTWIRRKRLAVSNRS